MVSGYYTQPFQLYDPTTEASDQQPISALDADKAIDIPGCASVQGVVLCVDGWNNKSIIVDLIRGSTFVVKCAIVPLILPDILHDSEL